MPRNLFRILTLVGLQTIAFGQSVTLSIGSGTASPGGAVSVPINLTLGGGAQTSGFQWSFSASPDISGITLVPGPSATSAGKFLSCSGNNCLIVGFNSNVMADGVVATATFQIAATPVGNPIAIQLVSVVATTPLGTAIPASGGSGAISLPGTTLLNSLNCSNSTIDTPSSTSCTVSLLGIAPGGGFGVSLSSNNASLTVPASVSVAAGQTSNSFTATGAQVSGNQTAVVTASAGGVNLTRTLNLLAPAQLTSLACTPSTLGSNASSTCTITLNKPATSAATISLTSNNGLLLVPATFIVPSGQSTATFAATSGSVSSSQSAAVTATLNGQSQQATISLAAAPQISSLTCSPGAVNAPGTSACTITMTAVTSTTVSVKLSSNNINITVPGNVNISAGLSSGAFSATVAAVTSNQTSVLTATLNGNSQTFTLTANGTQLNSLVCTPSSLGSNASSNCTLTLNKIVSSPISVVLASNNGTLSVPGSVVVAPGQSSAIFTATTSTVSGSQVATVTATLGGLSQQAVISLVLATQISSLICSPATVSSPGTSSCTVTLTAAANTIVSPTLLSNNANVSVPSSVNIGAGFSSMQFSANVAAVVSNQSAVLTATLNGISKTFTISSTATVPAQLSSLSCTPSTLASHVSAACTVTLNKPAFSATTVSLASNSGSISVPANATVGSGQSSATFAAASGTVSGIQDVTVTATLNGQSQRTTISLAVVANCEEFQISTGGLCMIQDLLPWVTFGGGWQSRLNAGNLSKGNGSGAIQFSFTLLPSIPVTGGVKNRLPAYFQDNKSKPIQLADNATYSLSAGKSVAVTFLYPPAGCDIRGQDCESSPDPSRNAYGSLQVQYLADKPAFLRGIAKAQLTLLASGSQATESEMSATNLWTGPIAVSANQAANSQTNQQASAALANPGPTAITVRGTLYASNGQTVTFRDFEIPALGVVPLVFSLDPNQPFGGFGTAMFPTGQDFNGLVSFQAISPSGGSLSAIVLQYTGNGMSSVQLTAQTVPAGLPASLTTLSRCAEFQAAPDGSCVSQYTLPWVVFGAGWESRLSTDNPPGATAGAVHFSFTLLPATSTTSGWQNHLPAYFTDGGTEPARMGESADYALDAGQSKDVHFLYPPAGCDVHGQNCANQSSASAFSFGSVLVQYSSSDPTSLRALPYPQLSFLARPSGEPYSLQMTEQGAATATTWTAPVAISAIQNADPATNQQASGAIMNPGAAAVTVRGALHDQDGNIITYSDFQIPAAGAIGIVFSQEPGQPFGGFGDAAFPQGEDFNGWVTFDVTSPGNGAVSVLILQYVGNTASSINVQALRQ